MKFISALALLLLIASCGHNHLRLVKAGPKRIVKTEKSVETKSDKKDKNTEIAAQITAKPEVINSTVEVEKSNRIVIDTDIREDQVDSTDIDEEEQPKLTQEEYDSAVQAEKNARSGKNFLIASFPFLIIPGIGWIISLALFGVGALLYLRARNSRYITKRGQHFENKARKLYLAYLIMLAVVALLFITSIVLIIFF